MSDFLAIDYQSRTAATTAVRRRGSFVHQQEPSMRLLPAAAAAVAVVTLAFPALAQHAAAPAASQGTTARLQGNDEQAWINDPHMHAFYETTRAAFAAGPAKVDVDGYEQKCFAIFRDFAPAMHMSPEGMVDHLKLIPRQVVQIVREDPKVLDSYRNFVDATFGPQ
jgi:hypothetical protein